MPVLEPVATVTVIGLDLRSLNLLMETRSVSARMETIGRGVFVIGLLAGVGARAATFGRSVFDTPPEAPATERLAPRLAHADVVYNRERQALSRDLGGRTVLLSVPQANNDEAAGRAMLLLLQ